MKILAILLIAAAAHADTMDTRENCEKRWDAKNRDAMHAVQAYLKEKFSKRSASMSCDFENGVEAVCKFDDGKVKHIKIDQKCMAAVKAKPDFQKNEWIYRAGCLEEAYGFWEYANAQQEKVICRPEPEYLKTATTENYNEIPQVNGGSRK